MRSTSDLCTYNSLLKSTLAEAVVLSCIKIACSAVTLASTFFCLGVWLGRVACCSRINPPPFFISLHTHHIVLCGIPHLVNICPCSQHSRGLLMDACCWPWRVAYRFEHGNYHRWQVIEINLEMLAKILVVVLKHSIRYATPHPIIADHTPAILM